jgi:rhomboid protease GluP
MDLNQFLLISSAMYAIVFFSQIYSNRANAADTAHWNFPAAAFCGCLVAGVLFAPKQAGLIGVVALLVFVVLPVQGMRLASRLIQQRQFRAAGKLYRVLRLVQPVPHSGEEQDMFRAHQLAEEGDTDRAIDIYQRLSASKNPMIRDSAIGYLHGASGQWQEYATVLESRIALMNRQSGYNQIMYLRALGESGQLARMLAALRRYGENLAASGELGIAFLYVYAFLGDVNRVQNLLNGPLHRLAEPTKAYWLAVALKASGRVDEANQRFTALMNAEAPHRRQRIARKISEAPVKPSPELLADYQDLLDRGHRMFDHATRYGTENYGQRSEIATYLTMAGIVAIFVVQLLRGSPESTRVLLDLGALVPQLVLNGQWWRVVNSMFLHIGFAHLVSNLLALWIIGPFAEHALGFRRFITIYFACGIGTSLVTVALYQRELAENSLYAGASAAIMGLLGASIVVLWRGWKTHQAQIARARLGGMVMWVVLQFVLDISGIFSAHTVGHLSGVAIGLLLALILGDNLTVRDKPERVTAASG